MNSRDEILKNENISNLTEIGIDDLDDLIQLAKFYQSKTPKSFNTIILSSLFGAKNGPKNGPVVGPISANFVMPISPSEIVKERVVKNFIKDTKYKCEKIK